MLDARFDSKSEEGKIYEQWMKLGVFKASADSSKKPYTIVLPPPNVTGVLHMGHALTGTLEDILIRRKRMQGFNALWIPGTDHAGIATQMVVERELLKTDKKTRHDLGREKFLEKVWEWKEKSQNTILSQLRTLGCSLDWDRLTFTLDENVSLAVRECFSRLYHEGLIYRDEAIIQWCPRCQTALSDLEVKFKEVKGKFWDIKYPLDGMKDTFLTVATTRPETLLGDLAIAVHPQDERYKSYQGKKVLLPLLNRPIPVLADSYVDKEFGTGVLKITPGHDPNDYLVGKRHGLGVLTVFNEKAEINELGGQYKGLSRENARKKILEDLQAQGLLQGERDHTHSVGHCDRCSTVVEPRVSAQWFVKAEVLAKPAIEAVEKGHIKIYPKEWEKTYFEWMYNIRPWCISRQLWWGHRIPVWYCGDCSKATVAVKTPTQCQHCKSEKLRQEDDVLDTWFSSGLWPFSTLGWPEETPSFKKFYPNDVMETGFDILFFWVARMIMLGMKMTGKIPFHTIYLHPMVRDEHGQKMSKTKGNVVDPLEIVDRMGADALRFFLTWNAYHGRDLRVSDDGVEACRNFGTKLWNVSKFVLNHFGDVKKSNRDLNHEVNQWIWERLNETKKVVNEALDQYRFFDAAQSLHHFLWSEYCDWFIEFIKGEELERRKAAKESTAVEVLEEILRLLHPLMPFMTERIWAELPLKSQASCLAVAPYPAVEPSRYADAADRMSRMISAIESIRTLKGVHQIGSKPIAVEIVGDDKACQVFKSGESLLKRLATLSEVKFLSVAPGTKDRIELLAGGVRVLVPKAELGDISKEVERRKKDLVDRRAALQRAEEKLKNEKFMNSAPENVRAGVVKQRDDLQAEIQSTLKFLSDLGEKV